MAKDRKKPKGLFRGKNDEAVTVGDVTVSGVDLLSDDFDLTVDDDPFAALTKPSAPPEPAPEPPPPAAAPAPAPAPPPAPAPTGQPGGNGASDFGGFDVDDDLDDLFEGAPATAIAPRSPAAPTPRTAASITMPDRAKSFTVKGKLLDGTGSKLTPELQRLKQRAHEELIGRLSTRLFDTSADENDLEPVVIEELAEFLVEENINLSDGERNDLAEELINDVLRHGPIEPLLQDEDVTEVMVNGPTNVYVEKGGKILRTHAHFASEDALRQVIQRIAGKVGRRIDESSPMVDARLPDGSRVNAVIPPLAVDGSSLTIRKFATDALKVEDLIRFKSMTPEVAGLLEACVRGRLNILVAGGTGSGKTTLLNVLSSFIPDDERIVTIEDSVELQLGQEHVVRLETRPANLEGRGSIEIRDLVKNSLRMRPDRIVIGECRGGEALDMLQAMNTGHDGSLSTLHANSPRDALSRLETMVLMAGMELPAKAIREQISSAVDLIVHLSRLRDGTRRLMSISEVVGMEGEVITLNDIFTFDFDAGIDEQGRFLGTITPTGLRPKFSEKLADYGVQLDKSLFETESAADIVGSW